MMTSFEERARAISWGDWADAEDVLPSLMTLHRLCVSSGELDQEDSDAWADAIDALGTPFYNDCMLPFTAELVPLLFELVAASQDWAREDVAMVLHRAVTTAADLPESPQEQSLQDCVDAVLVAHMDALVSWMETELETLAVFTALDLPRSSERFLARLEPREQLPAQLYAALAALSDEYPAWCLDRAILALKSDEPLKRSAAAAFLACGEELESLAVMHPDLIDLVARSLTRGTAAILERELGLPMELEIPPVVGPPQELVDATIIFAGASLIRAKVEDGKLITVRGLATSLKKGDTVRLGLSHGGEPLVVEYTLEDGTPKRVEL